VSSVPRDGADSVAQHYAGKVKIGKLNLGSNGNTTMRYNICGI
jgi:hypothetical protein